MGQLISDAGGGGGVAIYNKRDGNFYVADGAGMYPKAVIPPPSGMR